MHIRGKEISGLRLRDVSLTAAAVAAIIAVLVVDVFADRDATEALEARQQLMELDVVVHDLSALEWQAVAGEDVSHIRIHVEELIQETGALCAELAAGHLHGDLLPLVSDYSQAVERQIALIAEGRIEEAEELDEAVVDPLFERFEKLENEAIAELTRAVDRALAISRVVSISALIVIVVAAVYSGIKVSRLRTMRSSMDDKDRFLATVSHELRTPLTGIVGMTSILRDQWDDLDNTEAAGLVGDVAREGTEMAMLIEDLLVLARHDLTSVSVIPEQVDLLATAEQVLDSAAGSSSIDVELPGAPCSP